MNRETSRKRCGGRQGRHLLNKTPTRSISGPPKRKIPCTNVLDEKSLDLIESQTNWLLETIGLEFRDDAETLALFDAAGAKIDGQRVRFEPGLAQNLCSTAPSQFVMHGRDSKHSITMGDGSFCLSPGYGSPFVTDSEQGRRYATIEDFTNFVKLSFQSPWLHHSGGTIVEPVDIPVNKRHLDMVYTHLKYSTKPFMGSVTAPERAEDSIHMAKLVFGESFMEKNCVIQGNINLNSPLVLDNVMSGALKTYARANQCNFISPFLLGGAMGPVTQPALIAQAHAETIAAIALTQLVRKGSPVIYGNFLTTLDLRTGGPTFGTPEASLAIMALGQLSRRMNIPLRGIGHVTAAKSADAQAMQESSDSMTTALMAGSSIVFHAAGWLEGGLTMGYEKFMLDLDRCGMMCRMAAGLTIDANQLAREAYSKDSPGGNFLGCEHTLNNFKTANYLSDLLSDTQSYEQWLESGGLNAMQRATPVWKKMLSEYEPPNITNTIDDSLKKFIEDRKASEPDMWH